LDLGAAGGQARLIHGSQNRVILNAGWPIGKSSAVGLGAATPLMALAEPALEYSGHPL